MQEIHSVASLSQCLVWKVTALLFHSVFFSFSGEIYPLLSISYLFVSKVVEGRCQIIEYGASESQIYWLKVIFHLICDLSLSPSWLNTHPQFTVFNSGGFWNANSINMYLTRARIPTTSPKTHTHAPTNTYNIYASVLKTTTNARPEDKIKHFTGDLKDNISWKVCIQWWITDTRTDALIKTYGININAHLKVSFFLLFFFSVHADKDKYARLNSGYFQ